MVTMGKAGLWTDSRYWTQAEREMDCNWELHKEGKTTHGFVPQALEPGVGLGNVQVRGACKAMLGPYGNLGKFEAIPKL